MAHKKYRNPKQSREYIQYCIWRDLTHPLKKDEQWFLVILKEDKVLFWKRYGAPLIPNQCCNKIITVDALRPVLKELVPEHFIKKYFSFYHVPSELFKQWKDVRKTLHIKKKN